MPRSVQRTSLLGLAMSLAVSPLGAQQSAAPSDTVQHVNKTFFTRRDLAVSGIALAASAGVSVFDKRIASWTRTSNVQGSTSRHNAVKSLTVINEQPLTLAAFATYGIGRLAGWETVADVGLHTTETLVLTVLASEAIRGPLGRARPRISPTDQYNFSFWSGFTNFGDRSYPSIHAAVAWATATALTQEMRERHSSATPWVAPVLYTAALVPGFTRMYLDQHWASDVVAGTFLGAMLGTKVVDYAHSHRRTKFDRALLGNTVAATPDGRVVVMRRIDW